ncbi:HpcH/HpaI aldolase/citrate lyase family protein [Streptomyces sp. NPDC017979]|uniref:HpcH/HpaI aldolase/citrate lyase family protein n=1 Tax=Streptomyces sp. NPDC017979 TaxID=3365024 RepID=UPI0037A2EF30
MTAPVRRLRSLLSVPGGSERFVAKARDVAADGVAFDLEDSVPVADKERARTLVAATLPAFPAQGREVWVRPNALDSGLLEADLDAVVGPGLHGLHLPKVDDGRTLARVDHYLTYLERVRALAAGSIRLMAWIESPAALGRLEEICRATPRLDAVSLGSEDYTAALGVPRSADGEELAYARARLANAAAGAGIGALDGPETNFRAADLFRAQAGRARAVGLTGKFCIHPDQVALAHEAFAPTADETAWATRVVTAYEALGEGAGAVSLAGEMVDRPGYLRALRVLAH